MTKVESYRHLSRMAVSHQAALVGKTMAYRHPVDHYYFDPAQCAEAMT
jgi:hypothetical protein